MVLLAEAFLVLFCKVDKLIEVNPALDILKSRIWFSFIAYISTPGNVIVTMRKFPDFISEQRIKASTIKRSKESFSKIKTPPLVFIYQYLKTAYRLYDTQYPRTRSVSSKKTFVIHDPLFRIAKTHEGQNETPRFSEIEDEDTQEFSDRFVGFIKEKLSDGNQLRNRNEVYKLHAEWVNEYLSLGSNYESPTLLRDTLKFKRLVNQLRLEILKEVYSREKDKLLSIRQGLLEDL